MDERVLWASGHGALLLLVRAGIAFVSGNWAILLALGPAAYHLIFNARSSANTPTKVALSYGAAVVIGWIAYMAIAQGVEPTAINQMSKPGLLLVGSASVAVAGTAAIVYLLNSHQPMAFVAGCTAAFGMFPTVESLVGAVIAAFLLAVVQAIRRQYGPGFGVPSRTIEEWSPES